MTRSTGAERPIRDPSLFDAVAPLMALALLIGGSPALLGLHALEGALRDAAVLTEADSAAQKTKILDN
jgi:NhaC family Na+:H+ antiporter